MSAFGAHDAAALRRAVEVARRGRGWVEPNPCVGAVLYRGPDVLAEAWHREYGEAHAERELLSAWAGEVPPDASVAVSLEPCSSHGKQPPCCDHLVERGVRRVVVGEVDPDPRHQGAARARLEEAGIEVVMAPEGSVPEELLAPFRAALGRDRPEVVLKWATSLDGSWAPAAGEDRWISGTEARALVHRLRAHVDGIVVGSGTVLADDPLLTARPPGSRPLTRVVLDARGRLPADSQLVRTRDESPLWLVCGAAARPPEGVEALRLDDPHDLSAVLVALRDRGLQRILVEGGPRLIRSFLDGGLADRAWVFVGPVLFGGDEAGGASLRGDAAPARTQRPEVEEVGGVGCDAWFRLRW